MKILFYKPSFSWPRNSGHDVHTYHMMRSLAALKASVSLVTETAPHPKALAGLTLDQMIYLDSSNLPGCGASIFTRGRMEERFRRYYGIEEDSILRFSAIAERGAFDAVVVSGLPVLPMLLPISGPLRVWYAADEWVWHHWSQFQWPRPSTWRNIPNALLKGVYERAFRRRVDVAWLVSKSDARAMRAIAGIPNTEILPNGVDGDFYSPHEEIVQQESAVFWGRLDFGPNIQALEWFCGHVWPQVLKRRPAARFTIIGFHPSNEVLALRQLKGITILPDVEDIRPEVQKHEVVVLPFVSGGGIKNKFLEAAAMGKAIIAAEPALCGLQGQVPVRKAHRPIEWIEALEALWNQPDVRIGLGKSARDWVIREHNWTSVARKALSSLESIRSKQRNHS
jgi:glycosyltransferase involved in cell wall biosynthesis